MSDAAAATETAAPPPATTPAPQATERRPSVVNTIKHGAVVATPEGRDSGEVRTVRSSTPPATRSFTDHQKAMLANLDKFGDVNAPGDEQQKPVETPAATPAPTPASAATPTPEAKSPAPAIDADMLARHERVLEHNKRLVAELERRTSTAPEPDERVKALDEIERGLTTDFMGSLRKLVALNAGKPADSPDVDRLMAGGYAEWTAHELKMQMDPAQRAAIGTERNTLLIERHKREQAAAAKAAETKAAADAEAARAATIDREMNDHLVATKHADAFPLLMRHAQTFDRTTPGELVHRAIRLGIQAGEFPPETPWGPLINHYSKAINTHYQALLDNLGVATTSTAATTQPTVSTTDKQADAPKPAARAITNASASVAPPAPPAATPPDTNAKPEPKKWRNETQRRQHLAKHYFGDD